MPKYDERLVKLVGDWLKKPALCSKRTYGRMGGLEVRQAMKHGAV